jgi:hypothetical protein
MAGPRSPASGHPADLRLRPGLLFLLFAMLEQTAGVECLRRVDRVLPHVDVRNHSLLVDDEGRPLCQLVARRPDLLHSKRHTVLPEHLRSRIAEQREMNVELLGIRGICCRTVTTDSEHHRIACFQLGPISLIGFEFAASGVGKGEDVEDDDDILLSVKIAEFDFLPIVAQ